MASVYKKFTAQDFATIPFNAHKQYNFDSGSASTNKVTFINAQYISESVSTYTTSSAPNFSSAHTKNPVKYSQIDHLYYRNAKRKISNRFGEYHYAKQRRVLYEDLNIFSIPSGLFGHEIKPKSLYISTSKGEFQEDTNGNLIVRNTNIEDYVTNIESNILNIGPVNGFKRFDLNTIKGYLPITEGLLTYNGYENSIYYKDGDPRVNNLSTYSTPDFGDEFDDSYHFNLVKYKNVNFSKRTLFNGDFPAIDFRSSDTLHRVNLFEKGGVFKKIYDRDGGLSEIKIEHDNKFNFNPGEDFTITFQSGCTSNLQEFGGFPPSLLKPGHTDPSYIISKSTTKTIISPPNELQAGLLSTSATGALQPIDVDAGNKFPFEVFVQNTEQGTPHVFFRRSDGDTITTVSASFTTSSNTFATVDKIEHVVCRYKDSVLQIYINGLASGNTHTDKSKNPTENQANIYIGNKGGFRNPYFGTLSQINIYDQALTDAQILNHYSSSNGSPYVGNVFHKNGFVTITHPGYIVNSASISDGLNKIEFQGSHLIYEHEYQCTVDEHEFLNTLNLSARKTRSNEEENVADFATSSLFRPYITTIGLYNEDRELLVVGKLGQPVKTSDETDTTFVVRWDT